MDRNHSGLVADVAGKLGQPRDGGRRTVFGPRRASDTVGWGGVACGCVVCVPLG